MSLISKIKAEIEALGLAFAYDNGNGLNQLLDNADYSDSKCVVYAFLLSNTTFVDGKEGANVGLFFSKLTEYDFESIENDTIQQSCKEIAFEFLKQIEKGNTLTHSDVSLQYFYDEFSVNVTGVAINLVLTETVGLCYDTVYFPPVPPPAP